MIIPIKLIFHAALLLFVFFSGVKYSVQTREVANWLFEAKEQEIPFREIKEDINNNKNIDKEKDRDLNVDLLDQEVDIETDLLIEDENKIPPSDSFKDE